jgi:trimethylamine--corrinoid protein Co-methyltransferase
MTARLALLSDRQLEDIHQGALAILDEVGVVLSHPAGKALLIEHGGRESRGRIVLSPDLVESRLRACPAAVDLRGRGGAITLGDGRLHPHNLGGARAVLDRPDAEPRPATSDDLGRSTRLLDALLEVHSVTALYTPTDVPPARLAAVMFARTLENTLKPVQAPGLQTGEEAALIGEMSRIVLGEGPQTVASVSPVSPLSFPDDAVAAILEICRQGLAFAPLPCPILGATAPLTLAGALAQQHAEVLAAITLAQLAAPGTPCVYHGRISAMNMRTGDSVWGCPEVGLASAATVQLAHRSHLPVNVYGLCTSVYSFDLQSGHERTMNALLPALAGADELSGVGELAGGVASSPAQIVADHEILRAVVRTVKGLSADPGEIAVDLVAHVMDGDRNFLAERRTVQHLRSGEVWLPELSVQEARWEAWREAGGPTLAERARVEAERLLAEHEVPPLPEDQARELDRIVESIEVPA